MNSFRYPSALCLLLLIPAFGWADLFQKLPSPNTTFNDYVSGLEDAADSFASAQPGIPEYLKFTFTGPAGPVFTSLTNLPAASDADADSQYFISMANPPYRFRLVDTAHFASFGHAMPDATHLLADVSASGFPDESHPLFASGTGGAAGGEPLLLQSSTASDLRLLQESAGGILHPVDQGAPFHVLQQVDPFDGDSLDEFLLLLDVDAVSGISSGDPLFYLSGTKVTPVPEPALTGLALLLAVGGWVFRERHRRPKQLP